MTSRQCNWSAAAADGAFDVVVIGGGISGAATFRQLVDAGYRVLLVEKNDFAGGTSQASAMMIWGGLLYLKNLDFGTVLRLSRDRDAMIHTLADAIQPQTFRYIPSAHGRSKAFVHMALHFYWLMGLGQRQRPRLEDTFGEAAFLRDGGALGSIVYEEGVLRHSDCRFVLDWILAAQGEAAIALNHCQIATHAYDAQARRWRLGLKDIYGPSELTIQARAVVNCAGVWADEVNAAFGIESPYRHALSKGVFIGYRRPAGHEQPMIFEMGGHGDTLTFTPWGPISLWGPTETMVGSTTEGYQPNSDDVAFLRDHARRHLSEEVAEGDIVSLRCGVRPLAVAKGFQADVYPLSISRRHRIAVDPEKPWVSVYGGKISGCPTLSAKATAAAMAIVGPGGEAPRQQPQPAPVWTEFPGMSVPVIEPQYAVDHEMCCSLDDYLRRRTNVSQWIPRQGLGAKNENLEFLKALAKIFCNHDLAAAGQHVAAFEQSVVQSHDTVVKN